MISLRLSLKCVKMNQARQIGQENIFSKMGNTLADCGTWANRRVRHQALMISGHWVCQNELFTQNTFSFMACYKKPNQKDR